MTDDGDSEIRLDLDDPHVAENYERFLNNLYRALANDDIDFHPDDLDRFGDAIQTFSDEETQRIGRLSLQLELEGFEEREGMDFLELTDTEREYFDLIETGLERVRPKTAVERDAEEGDE